MPGRSVVFYFDFLSPYAYIAATQVHAIGERTGAKVELVPVLFAAILDAHGQKGPAEIPAKRIFTFKDAYRKAHRFGLPPLVPPPHHPFNPLLALRVASIPELTEAERARVVAELYAAVWRHGTGVETKEDVGRAVALAGLAPEQVLPRAESPDVKDRLKKNTAEAIGRNVFGVPTLWIDGEIFWGTDNLALAEDFLQSKDPIPPDLVLTDRPASAVRRAVR